MDLKGILDQFRLPQKGILFRDITTLIKNEKAFKECINQIVDRSKNLDLKK